MSPADACEMAVDRVISKNPDWRQIQVGFIALNKDGEYGGFCIAPGFNYAVLTPDVDNELIDSQSRR
jgi:N4-(beta-N-acetylglucosaminyl)-L-asparaginase